MEIINDKENTGGAETSTAKNPSTESNNSRGFYTFMGIVMVVVGFVWLGSNYNFLSPQFIDTMFSWQMIVVGLGVWMLCSRQWLAGGVIVALGVGLLVADFYHIYISFEKLILPVALMGGGVATILIKGRKQ